jgi:Ca2+/H+ antiporter
MGERLRAQRLTALAAFAAILFGAAGLWQGSALALFVAWALVIGVLAWLMERDLPPQ